MWRNDDMNEVKIWNATDNPFTFEMEDSELDRFLHFMSPQDLTDVFDHKEKGITYYIIKGHVSMMSYIKKVGY